MLLLLKGNFSESPVVLLHAIIHLVHVGLTIIHLIHVILTIFHLIHVVLTSEWMKSAWDHSNEPPCMLWPLHFPKQFGADLSKPFKL